MSHRDKILLAVIAVIGVFAGAFFLVVKPKRAELKSLDAQVTQQQSRVDNATAQIGQEQAARRELGNDVRGLIAIGKAVPTTTAMPALLDQLEAAGSSGGVKMTSLTTSGSQPSGASTSPSGSPSSPTPGVTSQSLALQFDGGFLDLQRFLTHLQNFVDVSRQRVTATGRLLSLDKVQLSAGKDGSGLTAQVDATIYTLQPSALAAGGSTPAAPGAPAPAGSSTPTPTATAGVPR